MFPLQISACEPSAMHRRHLPIIWKHAYDYIETCKLRPNLQKSKANSVIAVNSPHVNKGRTFRVHLLAESFFMIFKNTFCDSASGSALFLICS